MIIDNGCVLTGVSPSIFPDINYKIEVVYLKKRFCLRKKLVNLFCCTGDAMHRVSTKKSSGIISETFLQLYLTYYYFEISGYAFATSTVMFTSSNSFGL